MKARKEITATVGTFNDDTNSGNFSLPTPLCKIVGSYVMQGNNINFTITNKPILVSCSTTENVLWKRLGTAF